MRILHPKINGTSVSVLPANVIWEKNYGVVGDDDRAYSALPVGDGFLVVGSSESNKTGVTVGWALMLDQDGNVIWNQTFLEGSGTELRVALNLTDGFLLVGNEFLPSGGENGYVAKINSQGALIWQNHNRRRRHQQYQQALFSNCHSRRLCTFRVNLLQCKWRIRCLGSQT